MRLSILSGVLIFVSQLVFSQNNTISDVQAYDEYVLQFLTGERYLDQRELVKGIYFNDNWSKSSVKLNSGILLSNLMLRFDISENQLIWLNNTIGQIKLDNNNIDEFNLTVNGQDHHFVKHRIKEIRDNKDTYFEVAELGKLKFLIYRKVKFHSKYYQNDQLHYEYEPAPIYILQIRDKSYFIEEPKLKNLLAAFPDKKAEIRQKKRQSRAKIRNENDFIRFVISIENVLISE